jgi:hypothetical protein
MYGSQVICKTLFFKGEGVQKFLEGILKVKYLSSTAKQCGNVRIKNT